ncbi:hypothetical protein [Tengunoibacter tsumagoiensis]|uniref:Uncharacterized protein n=1 Tax=Tengunoibacter tsumagoiensis TaxID=2014871 RepID=A0A401ZXN2_9CHLR|nr:hypothetical protein [Tengunoibacter tsumagoiensis]GCE11616.1 hypothetical protein KTT_14750 [Tengunoibacter tsumagoiensis]
MYLHDNLQVCLYALESRYPNHLVDINPGIIQTKGAALAGRRAAEVVKMLAMTTPHLLEAPAEMIIDHGACAIYLPHLSTTIPLCIIHCLGKLPPGGIPGEKNVQQKQLFPNVL